MNGRTISMAGLLLAAAMAGCGPAGSATYYVDWEAGNDGRPGTTPESAWKHAPGDAEATARAAAASLQPGDRVLFRAGVPYRGAITNRWSGSADKPITFAGLGWGEGMGMIDGSDPVTSVRPCTSAADCGGAAAWEKLSRIEFTPPELTARIFLFGRDGLYWRSQFPVPQDPFYSNNTGEFIRTDPSDAPELLGGTLRNAQLLEAVRGGGGDMELAFWVIGNEIRRTPITSVQGDALHFTVDPKRLRLPTDRPGRVALTNSFAGLTAPGTFVTMKPGLIIAWLREGETAADLSIGSGRTGIDVGGRQHVRVDGLRFRNFSGGPGEGRRGAAIISERNSADVQVRGVWIGPAALEHGGGVVRVSNTTDFRLLSSRITDLQFASGIRHGGGSRNLKVQGNVFRRLGRTAVVFFSVEGGEISGNFLADIKGIHGNGITAYLSNRNILIANNCAVEAARPLTFHGDKKGGEIANDIVIRDNILVSTTSGQGAIISWGGDTNGVTITGNAALGNKLGILLNQRDRNIVVDDNETNVLALRGPARPDWKIGDNTIGLTRETVARGSYSESGCEMPGSRRTFRTTRTPD